MSAENSPRLDVPSSFFCVACGGRLAEQRPVFLIADGSGRIVGPYHSGCAAKVADRARRDHKRIPRGFEGPRMFGHIAREETLPW